jgi:hypothetical protein
VTDSLDLATRPRPRGAGVFEIEVPDGWQQGRGAFGGLTIASLARAIELAAGSPDRSLRSLTAELPAPVMVGLAEIHVEPVRAGSGQSTITARLVQDGEVRAIAVAVLARPRAPGAATFCELERPALRPWRDMPAPPRLPGGAPTFTQHFEYRTDGPFPYTSGKEARVQGWIRARNAGALEGGAYLAAMADAWWPATFTRAAAPFAVGTVAFTLQVVGTPGRFDPAVPLAYRAHVWVQSEGWFVEQRELWSEDGRLLALNQQTFAVIK